MPQPKSANEFFASGFNCAESVALAVCQALGLDTSLLPRMATGFGGGIAGSGATCGALVGAIMAVGLMYGRNTPEDDRRRPYAISQRIYSAFEQEMGSTQCRQLTGLDLRTPEGYRQLFTSGVHERVCAKAVALAERLALEQLRRDK